MKADIPFGSRFPTRGFFAAGLSLACASLCASTARAQCDPQWASGFDQVSLNVPVSALCRYGNGIAIGLSDGGSSNAGVMTWSDGRLASTGFVSNNPFAGYPEINDVLSFDFGSGPELVAAGLFDQIGSISTINIARWNGTTWAAMAGGLGDEWDIPVTVLCAFDEGSGSHLFAGGRFDLPGVGQGLARWNGSAWEPVGGAELTSVSALCVHDDGNGPALYVAGLFQQVAGVPAPGIAKWDGASWSAVGTVGMPAPSISSLISHTDVHGSALYACGSFTGLQANSVARWDGIAWTAVGTGANSNVMSLLSHDDGTGPALYAFGYFTQIGGVPAARAARWDGTAWSALGSGVDNYATTAMSWNDGNGPQIVTGGGFNVAGGIVTTHIALWKTGAWHRLSSGIGFESAVKALCVHDDGSGTKLFAGGTFTRAGDVQLAHIARFEGDHWSPLGAGLTAVGACSVEALTTFDDGNGVQLYAGGTFVLADGAPANGIARWNGASWSALPGGDVVGGGLVKALSVHDDGSGPALYAGGTFTHIGNAVTRGVARWDGTSWSALGTGISVPSPTGDFSRVSSLASHDDGHGRGLFVGGNFNSAGGVPGTRDLAVWRNGAWEAVNGPTFGGASNEVLSMSVLDDGSGPRLWLTGSFSSLGGYYAKGVGTWDGTRFWPVGTGFPNGPNAAYTVFALASFDDGSAHGRRIFATGNMADVGGTSCCLAAWDGSTWTGIDGGVVGQALAVQNGGNANGLWIGGGFTAVGTTPSYCIARLEPSCSAPTSFCYGDGSGTACPCGNAGASGNGCASSFASQGAHLSASGQPSVSSDSIVLTASDISPAPVTFFQGTTRVNGGAGAVFGDGLRCAGGTTMRLGATASAQGTAHYPGIGNPPLSVRGQVPASGGTRTYQAWYRNAAAFCTSSTFNLSNGVEIRWVP